MSGSIITALIRVMTSPPKGCCLLSIEATASGVPVPTSRSVATTVVVPRSKAIAYCAAGGVAGLHVDQCLVDDHRGDLEVGGPQHGRQPAQQVQVGDRLEVVDRVEQPGQVGALVAEVRLGELDVPLLDGRTQDHLAADADGRGLGPGGERRHVDGQVAGRVDQAGQPPALVELLAAEGLQVVPGDGWFRTGSPPRPPGGSAPCTCGRCRGHRRSSRSRCRSTTRSRRRSRPAAPAPGAGPCARGPCPGP